MDNAVNPSNNSNKTIRDAITVTRTGGTTEVRFGSNTNNLKIPARDLLEYLRAGGIDRTEVDQVWNGTNR